jgi:hypothetical protein
MFCQGEVMFIDGVRGWAGRPTLEVVPDRRGIANRALSFVGRHRQTTSSAVQSIPAADGATDDELVRVACPGTMDGAERNRHHALMLLYSSTGGSSRG